MRPKQNPDKWRIDVPSVLTSNLKVDVPEFVPGQLYYAGQTTGSCLMPIILNVTIISQSSFYVCYFLTDSSPTSPLPIATGGHPSEVDPSLSTSHVPSLLSTSAPAFTPSNWMEVKSKKFRDHSKNHERKSPHQVPTKDSLLIHINSHLTTHKLLSDNTQTIF